MDIFCHTKDYNKIAIKSIEKLLLLCKSFIKVYEFLGFAFDTFVDTGEKLL